jgi:hypothetical protein
MFYLIKINENMTLIILTYEIDLQTLPQHMLNY